MLCGGYVFFNIICRLEVVSPMNSHEFGCSVSRWSLFARSTGAFVGATFCVLFCLFGLLGCNTGSRKSSEQTSGKADSQGVDLPEGVSLCDRLADRNAACADAFVTQGAKRVREGMRETFAQMDGARREKSIRALERRFLENADEVRATMRGDKFRKQCRAGWNDTAQMPMIQKNELARCLSLADCEQYAWCFLGSADVER